jgi:GR25 family glycosyltransferase involved in LPS biosynthesis
MSIELPICRWRGACLPGDRYECSSPKLVVGEAGVMRILCQRCHCADHAPVAIGAPGAACPHLGRRIRDDSGQVKTRKCEPCQGKDLHLFGCDHPAIAGEVTLLDCESCQYRPGISQTIDRVYLVNLRRRTDRLAAFRARQQSHGWQLPQVEVWPAVEGDVVGVPGYFREGGGAWGCLRSHVGILEKCLMEGVNSVLVLEDDAEWMKDTWERLEVFLASVPGDWSQLMLGGQHMQAVTPVVPGVVRCANTQRTHAYALRGAAIKSLLRAWYTAAVHLDWVMGGDWQRNWPVYAPEPFIFGQAGGKSDISGRLNNALYWNPPTNALVVHLSAPPDVAGELRAHGLHMGFRRDGDGYDEGLARVVAAGGQSDKLAAWLSTILWEVASMEGRVACVFHPSIPGDLVERVHGGPVRRVAVLTIADGLAALRDLGLKCCLSSTHVVLLEAPRQAVEQLAGFHRGYWVDDVSGVDRGLLAAVAGDKVAGLRKWMRHAGEEAERIQAVPLVWCPGYALDDLRAAFPDRVCVGLAGSRVKLIGEHWSKYVSQADDTRGMALRSDGQLAAGRRRTTGARRARRPPVDEG